MVAISLLKSSKHFDVYYLYVHVSYVLGDRPVAEMHQISLERVALLSKVTNEVLMTCAIDTSTDPLSQHDHLGNVVQGYWTTSCYVR